MTMEEKQSDKTNESGKQGQWKWLYQVESDF